MANYAFVLLKYSFDLTAFPKESWRYLSFHGPHLQKSSCIVEYCNSEYNITRFIDCGADRDISGREGKFQKFNQIYPK